MEQVKATTTRTTAPPAPAVQPEKPPLEHAPLFKPLQQLLLPLVQLAIATRIVTLMPQLSRVPLIEQQPEEMPLVVVVVIHITGWPTPLEAPA
jgi:hypothetical protein